MTEAEHTLHPEEDLQEALDALPDGARLTLAPGTYEAGVTIRRSVTLVGQGGAAEVVLEAIGTRAVVAILGDEELVVTLEGLTLTDGSGDLGAGIRLEGCPAVTLRDCVLRGNRAAHLGGGIYLDEGQLRVERTVFAENAAGGGGAILADGFAHVRVTDSLFVGNAAGRGPAVGVRESAHATFERCTFVGSAGAPVDVRLQGRPGRPPSLHLTESIFASGVEARPPEDAVVSRCLFAPNAVGFTADNGNVQAPLALDENHRPTPASPALARSSHRAP